MSTRIRPIAGAVAFFTIAVLWTSTAFSELCGSKDDRRGEECDPWRLPGPNPGYSRGRWNWNGIFSRQWRVSRVSRHENEAHAVHRSQRTPRAHPLRVMSSVEGKLRRFRNRLLRRSGIGAGGGPTNLTLLGFNMRDGLRMTGKLGSGRGSSFEVALVGRDTVAGRHDGVPFHSP
jgi:hypothetical protein